MGKVQAFQVFLDKQVPIYLVGEILSGRFVIKISERLKINSATMALKGAARVHWSEQHGSGDNRRTVHYYGLEEYLNFQISYINKQGENDLYLEVGEHNYPFQIKLPETIPTSFEHMHGRIRYSLNGTIDIPWAFDKHVEQSITVINPVDLNLNPKLRQPYNVSDSRTLCCWCCKSEPIVATFSIMKSGFVPGELIPFKAVIDNKSNRDIHTTRVKLYQNVTLVATCKTRTWSRDVTDVMFNKTIAEGTTEEWSGVLGVPAICSSSDNKCRIILVNYYLVLCLDPNGPNMDISIPIPIFIGTIPMRTNNSIPESSCVYERSIFQTDENAQLEEKRTGDIENMNKDFSPSYPYYKDFSNFN